jgi:hypothetical protein
MKKTDFFLRFYGKTDEQIRATLDEMRKIGHNFKLSFIKPLKTSVNILTPSTSKEAIISFPTQKELKNFMRDMTCRKIYVKNAYPGKGAKLVSHKPGDISFKI